MISKKEIVEIRISDFSSWFSKFCFPSLEFFFSRLKEDSNTVKFIKFSAIFSR